MKNCTLALMISAALGVQLVSAAPGTETDSERAVYIVTLAEPAVASYESEAQLPAGAPKLAPTRAASRGVGVDLQAAEVKAYRNYLQDRRQEVLELTSQTLGRSLKPGLVVDLVVNAMSLELTAEEARRLAGAAGVRSIEKERVEELQTDAGPRMIRADALWSNTQLPLANRRGEGAIVGLVDSGINASHLSFAGNAQDGYIHTNPRGTTLGLCSDGQATCNTKLIGVYDMTCTPAAGSVPFRCDATNTQTEDLEPNDGLDVTGHGTHVGSIAVGNPLGVSLSGSFRPMSGVAPRANIISYKGCEDESKCRGSWTLAALNQAAADGVDVVNYSIGGSPFSPWQSASAEAMRGLRNAGVVVVVAAGNDGPGEGTVSSPGNAPWVLTAAASSHTRLSGSNVAFSGGAAPLPGGGTVIGANLTGVLAPTPLLRADPAECAQGSAGSASLPTGWVVTTYAAKLLACDTSFYEQTSQSANAMAAGAVGVLLLNDAYDGVSLALRSHSVPTAQIRYPDAERIRQWLATGSGHTAEIQARFVRDDFTVADILADFSGRGPTQPLVVVNTLKPDLTAPGEAILAASESGNNGLVYRSGTSMASPHLAGAAALLKSARPAWSADAIISALTSTAAPSVRLRHGNGTQVASPFEQGSGRADLSLAVNAGLSFDETTQAWLAANPASGGDPRTLNRPSIVDAGCIDACSFTRTVTALSASTWTASVTSVAGMQVSVMPANFTLSAGQKQVLEISVDFTDTSGRGQWNHARMNLVPQSTTLATTSVPVSIFSDPGKLPANQSISTSGEKGWIDLSFDNFGAMTEPRFSTTEFPRALMVSRSVLQDPSRSDPYVNIQADAVHWLSFSEGAAGNGIVDVLASSETAADIDIFVGADVNGDNLPQLNEELCRSTLPAALESCLVELSSINASTRYWVLLQNWQSSASGSDVINLEAAAIRVSPSTSAVAIAGPGMTESRQQFSSRVFWDLPLLPQGAAAIGYVLGGSTPSTMGDIGVMRVKISRDEAGEASRHALIPGLSRAVSLTAGSSHRGLFVDVPEGAQSMTVSASDAQSMALYLVRDPSAPWPNVGLAPPVGGAAASDVSAAADKQLTISTPTLQPGRWFVVMENRGTETSAAQLSVSHQQQATAPRLEPGPYYNPQRSGAGVYVYRVNSLNVWGIAWYAYLEDGTPVWYLGASPAPAADQAVWTVPLDRYTWNGVRTQVVRVGEARLTANSDQDIQFAWNLFGESGSEPMQSIPQPACASVGGQLAQTSGLWYSPTRSGFGYSVLTASGVESLLAYLYDGTGMPRWVQATQTPFGAAPTIPVRQLTGFCPLCSYQPVATTVIGSATRTYAQASIASIGFDFDFQGAVSGEWQESHPTILLADGIPCP